jgi:[ribosomal protein S5]-alanine N-acetyltransferase
MYQQPLLRTERLLLKGWTPEDADAGLAIFGDDEVARWLSPAMDPVREEAQMRAVIHRWTREDAEVEPPVGHWTVRRTSTNLVVGSITLRRLPPYQEDLELAWQFAPAHWGHGYTTEAARAVATWAVPWWAEELFAVMRPANVRAAKLAERLGMEWVGETDKYYDLHLDVYRLRATDIRTVDSV